MTRREFDRATQRLHGFGGAPLVQAQDPKEMQGIDVLGLRGQHL